MVFLVQTVPEDFVVPEWVKGPEFVIRKLTIDYVVEDFSLAIENESYIIADGAWGAHQQWPRGLTLRRDLADLGWHETEFRKRTSFAYAVLNEDQQMFGCVYVMPTQKAADAEVYYWVSEDAHRRGLLEKLGSFVKMWLSRDWPFTHVIYPLREISWSEYQQLPNKAVHVSQDARVGGADAEIG